METKKLQASLEKACGQSELFQRKNAKLEKDNDQLRVENQELLLKVSLLREQLTTLQKKLSSHDNKERSNVVAPSLTQLTTDPHTGLSPDPLPELSKDTLYEVKTLRKVKRELENQLKESKSSTLSFQASFQAEFDLRTQTEQRLDQLRERYERLVIENDQLRTILRNNMIQAPPAPGLFSLPGSRPKKHPPRLSKARSVSVYSDLSVYTDKDNLSRQPVQTNGQSTPAERCSEKRAKSVEAPGTQREDLTNCDSSGVHDLSNLQSSSGATAGDVSLVEKSSKDSLEQHSTNSPETVLVPDAQSNVVPHTEHDAKDTKSLQEAIDVVESCPKPSTGEPLSQDVATATSGFTHPITSFSKTDTVLRSAQGYLVRMEKMSDTPDVDERESSNEVGIQEDKNEPSSWQEENGQGSHGMETGLEEMMSVSSKQLESAKAFYAQIQASAKRSSYHDPTT